MIVCLIFTRTSMRCINHSAACRLGGDVGTGSFSWLRSTLEANHSGRLHCKRLRLLGSKSCTAVYLIFCPNNMARQVAAICKVVRLTAKTNAIVRSIRPNMCTDTVWASSCALLARFNAWTWGGGSRTHLKYTARSPNPAPVASLRHPSVHKDKGTVSMLVQKHQPSNIVFLFFKFAAGWPIP